MSKSLFDWNIELNNPVRLGDKIRAVKKVRRKLKVDLISFTILLIVSVYFMCYNPWFGVFAILSLLLMYKNLRIWKEVYDIKAKRFKEYNKRT